VGAGVQWAAVIGIQLPVQFWQWLITPQDQEVIWLM